MKRVILCPNPYRDSELMVAKRAKELLDAIGFETVVCLPFSREGYDDQLGVPIRQLQQEIKRADMLIAFGGDGTILHLARTVALHSVPVLGINLGSLGFMSELEPNELERLIDLKDWSFAVEARMMLDVTVLRDGKPVYSNIALNDAVISKGSVARVVRLDVSTEEGPSKSETPAVPNETHHGNRCVIYLETGKFTAEYYRETGFLLKSR